MGALHFTLKVAFFFFEGIFCHGRGYFLKNADKDAYDCLATRLQHRGCRPGLYGMRVSRHLQALFSDDDQEQRGCHKSAEGRSEKLRRTKAYGEQNL